MYFTNKLNYVAIVKEKFLNEYSTERIKNKVIIYDQVGLLSEKCFLHFKDERFKICKYY